MKLPYTTRVFTEKGNIKAGQFFHQDFQPLLVTNHQFRTDSISVSKLVSKAKTWQAFEIQAGGGSGTRKFKCDQQTKFLSDSGILLAKDVEPGMRLHGLSEDFEFTPLQKQLIFGTMLGDGSMRYVSEQKASLRIGHGYAQEHYMMWKKERLGEIANKVMKTGNGKGFDTRPLFEFAKIHDLLYVNAKRYIIPEYIKELGIQGVAVWYQDDGNLSGSYKKWGHGKSTICVKGFDSDSIECAVEHLITLGFDRPTFMPANGSLLWSGQRAKNFQELVAPYMFLKYKLPARYHEIENLWPVETLAKRYSIETFTVRNKYDIDARRETSFQYSFHLPKDTFALLDGILAR